MLTTAQGKPMHTRLCDVLNITHPVVQAGMGGATNPDLVAAVSNAGGLGILGCGWSSADEVRRSLRQIRTLTDRPFGVNFVLQMLDETTFQICLDEQVPVFSFFRGEPASATARAKATGAKVIHQVTTLAEAVEAAQAGVDVLVAQGVEAGGHSGRLPLWTLLPEVVAIAGHRPVLAAGGIVDGQGLAAALAFGAAGVLMGTRFLATPEASTLPAHKLAIVNAGIGDTLPTLVWDILWGEDWPGGIRTQGFRNALTDRWDGREDELWADIDAARAEFAAAEARQDITLLPFLAGVGAARIRAILPAADIVRTVVREADEILGRQSLQR
jgi:nitronate monooxygenase